jgi:hypothetical protein
VAGLSEPATCTWTLDVWDEDGGHETTCGHAFLFTHLDEKPITESGYKFCVYCGLPITEVRVDRYADEDGPVANDDGDFNHEPYD